MVPPQRDGDRGVRLAGRGSTSCAPAASTSGGVARSAPACRRARPSAVEVDRADVEPSRLGAHRCRAAHRRRPARRRRRRRRARPRTARRCWPTASTSLTARVGGERVAGDQPDHAAARPGAAATARLGHLGRRRRPPARPRARVGQGAATDGRRPSGSAMTRRPRASASAARTVSRPGSPGPAPTKVTPAGGACAAAGHRVLPICGSLAEVGAIIVLGAVGEQVGGERRPERRRRRRAVRWPRLRDGVAAVDAVTEPRRNSSGPSSPSAISARRADGRGAAGLQRGQQRALGGDAARVSGSSSAASELAGRARRRRGTRRPARPAPGAGSTWIGSRISVISSQPAEPAQPGAGEHDGVELAVGDLAAAGCRRCRGSATTSQPEAERAQLGHAARRPGADRGARRGSSPRVRPSRATARRAGPRAGTAASAEPSAGAVGRSL